MDGCLTSSAHGIQRPMTKTGAYPPNQPARNRHNGALLPPSRRNPVAYLLEGWITGQRPPRRFNQHMAQATRALTADMAPPNRCSRGVLTRCQAARAAQGSLIGKASHVAQFGGSGPCHHLADAWGAPIDFFEPLLGVGLRTQQTAQLEELARGKAPLIGQQRETCAEFRR